MSRRPALRSCLWTLVLLAAPLGPGGAQAGTALDADGKAITVIKTDRVLTLGGPVSEVVAALGRADDIIAVDDTTQYPPSLSDRPRVGYLRRLGAEGLLSQGPDLVIAQNDAGPDHVLAQVAAAGVPVLRLPPAHGMAGLDMTITRTAAILGVEPAGDRLTADLHAALATLPGQPAPKAPRVTFLLLGHGATLTPGQDTAVDALLTLAGLRNAFAALDGWKPVSAEALVDAVPDGIVVSQDAMDSLGGAKGIRAQPLLTKVPALQSVPIVALDPTLLQGLGPRTPQAARQLAEAFGTLDTTDTTTITEDAPQ